MDENTRRELIELFAWAVSEVNHAPNPMHTHAFPHCEKCQKLERAKALLKQLQTTDL